MPDFDLSKVQYSRNDIRREVKIPAILTTEFAELLGIFLGDGHIGCYKNKTKNSHYCHYELYISGNIKEIDYYRNYINNLIFSVFNVRFSVHPVLRQNLVNLRFDSKAIFTFLSEVIGIPSKKDDVAMPKCIIHADIECKSAFLRGLADTDMCLTVKYKPKPYPVIQAAFKSKALIQQCSILLEELAIKNWQCKEEAYYEKRKITYTRYRCNINGNKRVSIFLQKIGFSNPAKTEKYRLHFDMPKRT